jgi:hypothetical protein
LADKCRAIAAWLGNLSFQAEVVPGRSFVDAFLFLFEDVLALVDGIRYAGV